MNLGFLNQTTDHEQRVVLTPIECQELKALGFEVMMETNAGEKAGFNDVLYQDQGVQIVPNAEVILNQSHVVFVLAPLSPQQITLLQDEAWVIGLLNPFTIHNDTKTLSTYADKKITTVAMELLPRLTRVQTMDVLSSQNSLGGYRSVLEGCYHLGRALPMMVTAAGTIHPAKVLVIGAGVAGLQAIATAKRLGAIVSAYDVRPSVKEQIESLGATFVHVAFCEDGQGEGGYAKQMSETYQFHQDQTLLEHTKSQDMIITCAQIAGKSAPILITQAMMNHLKPGVVIVDMATGTGGNCIGSKANQVVKNGDATIIGYVNMASRIPQDASALLARNFVQFLHYILKTKKESLTQWPWTVDLMDEVFGHTILTNNGSIIHPDFQLSNAV